MPKSRSVSFSPKVPDELRRYRTLLLSSGERSLFQHARTGSTDRLPGAQARLIDVPIPTNVTGIFDRLGKAASGRRSASLASELSEYAIRRYGTAGSAFIEALVADARSDKGALRKRLEAWMRSFLDKVGVNQSDSYEVRFAKRFALAYAAGLLAIRYGIVPWDRGLVMRCLRRVYKRTIASRSNLSEPVERAVSKILDQLPHLAAGAVNIKDKKNASGALVLRLIRNGQELLALRPNKFKKLVGPETSEKTVAAELQRRGVLMSRSNGRRTLQLIVPGVNARCGYYCLKLALT